MTSYANLKIQNMSMQFSDNADQKAHDLDIGLKRQIPFNLLSEIDTDGFLALVESKAEQWGFKVVAPTDPETDRRTHEPILVHKDLRITSKRFVEVIAPGITSGKKHGPRGITTVRGEWKGNKVSVSNLHALTDWDDPVRFKKNMLLLHTLCDRINTDAAGKRLAFGGGDLNWDHDDSTTNEPGEYIREHGLISIFEALGQPDMPTHGSRTIDLQWYFKGDKRVTPLRVNTIQDDEVFTFKDHDDVVGTYRIRLP